MPENGYASLNTSSDDGDVYDYNDVQLVIPESQLTYVDSFNQQAQVHTLNNVNEDLRLKYPDHNEDLQPATFDGLTNKFGTRNPINSLDSTNAPVSLNESSQFSNPANVQRQAIPSETENIPNTLSPVVETPPLRWALRKRKAIQKMPYSLDKIFHQELLKGHKLPDLQDIDASQIALRLPGLSITPAPLKTSTTPFWDYENEDSDDDDFEIDIPKISGKQGNTERFDSSDEEQFCSPSTHTLNERSDEEDLLHKVSHRARQSRLISDEESQISQDDRIRKQDFQSELAQRDTELVATIESDLEDDRGQSQSDDEVPEDIIFRGKVVNLKHGYKGLLPKAVWEAQLRKQYEKEKRASHKHISSKDRDPNKKGVAKKKKKNALNPDKSHFLQELLANSSQEESTVSADLDPPVSDLSKLPYNSNEAELMEKLRSRIDLQYADAYHDNDRFSVTSSTSSNHNTFIYDEHKNIATLDDCSFETKNNIHMSHDKNSDKENEVTKHETSSEDSVMFQKEKKTMPDPNTIESAEEYDFTDYMLSRDYARAKPNDSLSSTKNTKPKSNSHVFHSKNSKSTQFQTKRLNGQQTKPKKLIQTRLAYAKDKSTCFSDGDSDVSGIESLKTRRKGRKDKTSFAKSANVLLKNTKKHANLHSASLSTRTKAKRKKKIAEYFAFSDNSYVEDAHKKLAYYTTVVEAPGTAFTIGRASGALSNEAATAFQTEMHDDLQSNVFLGSPIFHAIFDDILYVAPDTISVSIGDSSLTVSAFSNDYLTSIKRVLVKVVKVGATDVELINLLNTLIQFFYHKNNTGLLEIVQAFQKEFTKKLVRVKEKAKPIHFYTLATCHLLLYEILLYSSVTPEFKTVITGLIIESLENYFCTYAFCYSDAVRANDPLILESNLILKLIVEKIDGSSSLWQRFSRLKISKTEIFETVVNFFPPPSDKPLWNLMVPQNDSYSEICEYVKFIQLGINACNWPITNEMILQFYGILKRRKFMDYKQELILSPVYNVVGVAPILEANSIFNFFLNVLNLSTVTTSLLERITPLGNLVESENPSQLPNRLNLLLMLALKTGVDFENKFEQLLTPALATVGSLHYKLILDGLLSLYMRKDANGLTVKASSLPACYAKASSSYKPVFLELWKKFIYNLKQALSQFKGNKTNVLVSLSNIMLTEIREKVQTNYDVVCLLLDVICSNLSALEPKWVDQNIFQTLSFESNDHVFKYYCKVLSFLIENNYLTLWSALTYNPHASRLSKISNFLFYESILKLCNDEASFLQVTPFIIKIIVQGIFEAHSAAYLQLVKQYFNKDNKITKQFVIHSVTSRYENICQIINFIGLSKDMNTISLLMQSLKSHCDSGNETGLCQELVTFINKYLIDMVKNNQIFHYLKQKYNISNTETEKSIFKDKLRGISSLEIRSELIVEEFSQVIQFNLNLQESIDKVHLAIKEIEAAAAFKMLTETIKCLVHIGTDIAYQIAALLSKDINCLLEEAFLYVNERSFLILLTFCCNTCCYFKQSFAAVAGNGGYPLEFTVEFKRLLKNMLFITENFHEAKILKKNINVFKSGHDQRPLLLSQMLLQRLKPLLNQKHTLPLSMEKIEYLKIEEKKIKI